MLDDTLRASKFYMWIKPGVSTLAESVTKAETFARQHTDVLLLSSAVAVIAGGSVAVVTRILS